jgi:hypothetical protein
VFSQVTSLRVEPKLKRAEEIEIILDAAGLDVLDGGVLMAPRSMAESANISSKSM